MKQLPQLPTTDDFHERLKWGSHLPALAACLARSTGPVLELGGGHFSTPFLHAFCISSGRPLITVETDATWKMRFADCLEIQGHEFMDGPYRKVIDELVGYLGIRFGVAFIDQSPGGQERAISFQKLAPASDYVVVHDYHGENEKAIGPLIPPGSSAWVTDSYFPPTLVFSQRKRIPEGLKELGRRVPT